MKKRTFIKNASSTARLAAIQALYEFELVGGVFEDILDSFKEKRWLSIQAELNAEFAESFKQSDNLRSPDRRVFKSIARGVIENKSLLDRKITVYLDTDRAFAQLELIAKTILRAAAFELLYKPRVPTGVICSDYVSIANAFFTENQPKLINAVIDAVAVKAGRIPPSVKNNCCSSSE